MPEEMMKPSQTFMYSRGGRGRGMGTVFNLTEEEIKKVAPVLMKLNTTADAIRYLYDQGWSNAAICKVITYPTDTMYHKRGDNLLPQHVATTISKYRVEKESNPDISPIRNVMINAVGLVRMPPNLMEEVDVNPTRQTVEEAAKEPTAEQLAAEEAELEREIAAEEAAKREAVQLLKEDLEDEGGPEDPEAPGEGEEESTEEGGEKEAPSTPPEGEPEQPAAAEKNYKDAAA